MRSENFDVRRELYEKVLSPTVIHGVEALDKGLDERHKRDVMESLRSVCGVITCSIAFAYVM